MQIRWRAAARTPFPSAKHNPQGSRPASEIFERRTPHIPPKKTIPRSIPQCLFADTKSRCRGSNQWKRTEPSAIGKIPAASAGRIPAQTRRFPTCISAPMLSCAKNFRPQWPNPRRCPLPQRCAFPALYAVGPPPAGVRPAWPKRRQRRLPEAYRKTE